jgi:hypothetical protein
MELLTLGNGKKTKIEVVNSQINVSSSGIRAIEKMGLEIVPVVVDIMETEGVSFDTFVRGYCACNGIIRKIKPSLNVYWSGSCDLKEDADGNVRIVPLGQVADEKTFRRKVVADIRAKLRMATDGR